MSQEFGRDVGERVELCGGRGGTRQVRLPDNKTQISGVGLQHGSHVTI